MAMPIGRSDQLQQYEGPERAAHALCMHWSPGHGLMFTHIPLRDKPVIAKLIRKYFAEERNVLVKKVQFEGFDFNELSRGKINCHTGVVVSV